MSDYQNVLEELQNSMSDFSEPTKEKVKKVVKPKKKTNKKTSNLFSQSEMDELSKEFMNYEASYDEPNFTQKTKEISAIARDLEVARPSHEDNKEVLQSLHHIQETLNKLDKKVQVTTHTEEANSIKIDEDPQPLEIVKLLVSEIGANENAKYILQTKDGVSEIALSSYYDMSKFVSMLQQYKYSMVLDKNITFENGLYNTYRDMLIVISQNILANSFRFFQRNDILAEIIHKGRDIKSEFSFVAKAIGELEVMFLDMQNALTMSDYKKDFYFAKHFTSMGYILNAVTIMNEMLGEYVVASARTLSPYADERIQSYLDKIELSRSSRKAYYKLYTSARDFFKSNFTEDDDVQTNTFFPFRDSGNDEIENKMRKMYVANKGNKKHLFISFSELIDRVRWIRNDLAHGNTSRAYKDITADIDEILIDFEYLTIKKNFLQM